MEQNTTLLERLQQRVKMNRQYSTGGPQNRMQQYQGEGTNLPGGQMQPIPGSDAVEFIGNKHGQSGMGSDSGILLDDETEVEGDETMDQVTMRKGGARDYFFSSHLKKEDGNSYADHHKAILQNGGAQGEIDTLARMQEHAAGRDVNKIARTGGARTKLQHGGPPPHPPLETGVNGNPLSYMNMLNASSGEASAASTMSRMQAQRQGKKPDLSVASDKYLNEYGDIPGSQPGVDINGMQYYLKDADLQNYITNHEDFGKEWMSNADPRALEEAGIADYSQMSTPEDVLKYQKAWNKFNPDNRVQEDGFNGEQTIRTGAVKKEEASGEPKGAPEVELTTREPVVNKAGKRDMYGNLIGLSQLIPAIAAYKEKPDYMDKADRVAPGTIVPERMAKVDLEEFDYNDQLAKNANDAAGLNRFIETSGGGASTIAQRMASYGKKQQGDEAITAAETRANTQIRNQEGAMEAQRRAGNAGNALSASAQNASSQLNASKFNVQNDMMVDEFNSAADAATKDRRLMALDSGVKTIASMRRDKLQYDAQERLASAISGQSGVYNREIDKQKSLFAKMGGYRKT